MHDHHLLGRLSSPLVPREVESVRLGFGGLFGGLLNEVLPAVLLNERDGLLLVGEVNQGVGQRVASRGPAHQIVLPPLSRLKLNPPPLDTMST